MARIEERLHLTEQRLQEAEERAQQAEIMAVDAERRWRSGIQPVEWPTREAFEAIKQRYGYTEGKFHLAIAGVSGTGKSSLINSFRGLRDCDTGAAATDVVESTTIAQPYPDPNPQYPFIWFDIPGAGTLNIPDWTYFNDEGLYIFDSIIILFDNRFTAIDIAILKNCRRYNIPCYIVRSKSDRQIEELARKELARRRRMENDSDDEDEPGDIPQDILEEAKKEYIVKTRESVSANLCRSDLTSQEVYLVSRDALYAVKKAKRLKRGLIALNEKDLLNKLFSDGLERRCPKTYDNVTNELKQFAKTALGFEVWS